MIFKPEMVEKILAGEKTVTRRPVKFESVMPIGALGPLKVERACRYGVGKTYAVQPPIEDGPGKGRGGKEVGRIRILSVRRGLIAGVDADEARREGFPSVVHFRRYWCRLYDLDRFPADQLVDRIEFEVLPSERDGQ